MTKPRGKYTTISFPEEFFNSIQEYVKVDTHYKSVAEFVRVAIREKMSNDTWKNMTEKINKSQSESQKFVNDSIKIASMESDIKKIIEFLKMKRPF